MATREARTPAWLIERLAHGELDGETAAEVRARLVAEGRVPDDEIAALGRHRDFVEQRPGRSRAIHVHVGRKVLGVRGVGARPQDRGGRGRR